MSDSAKTTQTLAVGIDLGTTNSLATVLTPDGPQVIPNALGERLTPSCVALDDKLGLVVGKVARELHALHPQRAAAWFKRDMGTDRKHYFPDHARGAVELSGLVLKAVKQDVERYLGQPLERAVISVPAYFNESQRSATMQAAKLAGIEPLRLVNEPTAAAIAYGLEKLGDEATVIVLDLGGGTFDVTLLEIFEGVVEVTGSAGNNRLGGEDFTDRLCAAALERVGSSTAELGDASPRLLRELRVHCEQAKRALAGAAAAMIPIPEVRSDGEWQVQETWTVSQQDFAELTRSLTRKMREPILRVLSDAEISPKEVEAILLVGGATRMRVVQDLAEEIFGQPPQLHEDPDCVVALGAAVQAGLILETGGIEDLVVTDVTSFSMGVEIVREIGGRLTAGYFSIVIPRNTTLPVSRSDLYYTTSDNQHTVELKIYQGEARRVADNEKIGELTLSGLPPGPAGVPVEVRFTHDLNGLLQVEAKSGNRKADAVIQRGGGSLGPEAIEQALDQMESLKVHPRESLRNRYLLTRAERVIAQLMGERRRMLEQLVDDFESALEQQEPEQIESTAARLKSGLDMFAPEDGEG